MDQVNTIHFALIHLQECLQKVLTALSVEVFVLQKLLFSVWKHSEAQLRLLC